MNRDVGMDADTDSNRVMDINMENGHEHRKWTPDMDMDGVY
jgi:hypothetical protein